MPGPPSTAPERRRPSSTRGRPSSSTRASEDRGGLSSAALLLGRLLFAQVRFAESEQLADELLAAFGEARDPATVRLLVMRADAALGGRDAYEDAGRDSELALEIARELGDPRDSS